MEDATMADPGDSLVARRPRRSTAGNRQVYVIHRLLELIFTKMLDSMEAALAEMALDVAPNEVDDDNDFINEKGSLGPPCRLRTLI